MNVKILVCCHKKDICASNDFYFPIHVGKAISSTTLDIEGDDTGDNISYKNPNYCELTGIYWAWKNLKNTNVIGLCHYRRYFDFHNYCRKGFPVTEVFSSNFKKINLNIPIESLKIEEGKAIMPSPITELPGLIHYCICHNSDDLKILYNVIKERGDNVATDAFLKVMAETELSIGNMFIMNWRDFDRYCEWLFSILFEVERRTNISSYNTYQKRIYGFMSERLLNVFMLKEGIEVKYIPTISFNDNMAFDFNKITPLHYQIRRMRNKILSKLIDVKDLL